MTSDPDTTDERRCPDDGYCGRASCNEARCFRVQCCGPLSGVFPGDRWPASVFAQFGDPARHDPAPTPAQGDAGEPCARCNSYNHATTEHVPTVPAGASAPPSVPEADRCCWDASATGCPYHGPHAGRPKRPEASAPVVGDGEVEALVPGVIADRHGEEFWFGGRICVPRRYSEGLTWGGGFALNSPRGISDHQPFRQVAVLMTPAQVADREHEAWERGYDARGVDISNEGLTETTLTPNPYPRSTP